MKTLRAEDVGYVVTTRVENILCFIYISNQGSLKSMVEKTLGDNWKAPKNCFQMKDAEKDIIGA
jgi:hypothetical protein